MVISRYLFINVFLLLFSFFIYQVSKVNLFLGNNLLEINFIIMVLSCLYFYKLRPKFDNPYIYLLPVIPYYLMMYFMGPQIEITLLNRVSFYYSVSLFSFGIGFNTIRHNFDSFTPPLTLIKKNVIRLSILVLILNNILPLLISFGDLGKGVYFILKPVFEILFLYSLFSLSAINKKYVFIVLLSNLTIVIISTIGIDGYSRYSIITSLLLFFIVFSVGDNFSKNAIRLRYLFISIFCISIIVFTMNREDALQAGGDALILNNGAEVIQKIDMEDTYYPLMPIYNLGFNIIPDLFWFDSKPKNYNTNAWYLKNIYGVNPNYFQWGVGIGGVAAAYMYGGLLGIIFIYFMIGLFTAFLYRSSRNSYLLLGVMFYYLLLLPIGMYRLDQTFFFGLLIFNMFFIFIFIWLSKKYEN